MAESNNYKHILKYTSIFGSVQGLNILINLVRNKAVALLLGPMGMGLAAIYNTTVLFMSEATNLGLPTSAVRGVSDTYENDSSDALNDYIKMVRGWSLVAALIGFLACVLLGPLFSEASFGYGNHTLHYILLSPAVAFAAVTGGEMAIMKGARCLRPLAMTQLYTIIAALVVAVPIYYLFDYRGVIPVIVGTAFVQMLITMRHSYRQYPLVLAGMRSVMRKGGPMLRLGFAFVLTGIIGKGSELVVRYYLGKSGDLDTVGLYNAGFMLAISYAGMVFAAMETDYYPRLSGINGNVAERNQLVNNQIEVSILLVGPLLLVLMLAMPIFMPLLFEPRFMPIVPMAQVAVLAMFFKSVTLPVAYLPLAKANSVAFVLLELVYAVAFVPLVVLGYRHYGLYGTGLAIVFANVLDYVVVWIFAALYYHFRPSGRAMRYFLFQIMFGVTAYAVTVYATDVAVYVALGLLTLVAGGAYSARVLLEMKKNS